MWAPTPVDCPPVALLDTPRETSWRHAMKTLEAMGVVEPSCGQDSLLLTANERARRMAALPVAPRLAHMLLRCAFCDKHPACI